MLAQVAVANSYSFANSARAMSGADSPATSPKFTKITSDPITAAIGRATGIGVADYNGDGFEDVFISVVYGSNVLYTNAGNGSFQRVNPNPVASGTLASAGGVWGDYDNDGFPDLFVSVNNQANDLLYRNADGTSLSRITAGSPVSSGGRGNGCAWIDYDCDGYLDLYVCNSDQNNFLYRNLGNGTFKRLTTNTIVTATGNSQACTWGDYDNDGYPDLFLGKGVGNNLLYHNERNGKFSAMPGLPMSKEGSGVGAAAWVDYDNDGFSDLFVPNYNQTAFLYHNNGDGTFLKVTNSALTIDILQATSSAWADYDNDGYLDVFITQIGKPNLLFHNDGNGNFTKIMDAPAFDEIGESTSAAWVDIDNDGFSDLILPNYHANKGELFRNNGNGNHWIAINCEGRTSNRSAIGAKVRIKTVIAEKEMWQLREIGFQADPRAQFGLGSATNVSEVRVEWPSGIVQRVFNVAADQFLRLCEPSELSVQRKQDSRTITVTLTGGAGQVYEIQGSRDLQRWERIQTVTNLNPNQEVEVRSDANQSFFFRSREKH
jgi:hypothetical protein